MKRKVFALFAAGAAGLMLGTLRPSSGGGLLQPSVARGEPTPQQRRDLAKVSATAPATAPTRQPHSPPKPGEIRDMDIRDLGNFDYDAAKGGAIPDDVRRLNGATLRLKGFMIPMEEAEKISQFALVPSLFSCCFGRPPGIQHVIMVSCRPGKKVDLLPDQIVVEGVLTVRETKEDGYVVSLFQLVCTDVRPVRQ